MDCRLGNSYGIAGHTQWSFFELSPESYLEGIGSRPANYNWRTIQPISKRISVRKGANALGGDLGMAGAFYYNGILNLTAKIALKSSGTMNGCHLVQNSQNSQRRLWITNNLKLKMITV
jgi:hypothetical protein